MIGANTQEDRLWIADPKAINHILQKSGYFYAKPAHIREQVALLADRNLNGIASVEGGFSLIMGQSFSILSSSSIFNGPTGNAHKLHRRAMAPAFGLVEAKGLLPYFMDSVTKGGEPRLRMALGLGADLVPTISWQKSGARSSRTASLDIQQLST